SLRTRSSALAEMKLKGLFNYAPAFLLLFANAVAIYWVDHEQRQRTGQGLSWTQRISFFVLGCMMFALWSAVMRRWPFERMSWREFFDFFKFSKELEDRGDTADTREARRFEEEMGRARALVFYCLEASFPPPRFRLASDIDYRVAYRKYLDQRL